MEWNTEYNGISISYRERFVHIKTDSNLLKYLGEAGNGSIELAEHIKKTYQLMLGKELHISKESLSVEILVHAYLDVLLRVGKGLSKMFPPEALKDLVSCMEELKGHTKIIDCGEKEVDYNRHVFDSLVPYRHLIYKILGKMA